MARAIIGGIIFGIMLFSVVCFMSGEMTYVAGTAITILMFVAVLVIVEWLVKKLW